MILVRFGLEWGAVVAPDQQPYQQAASCRRIVGFWDAHGVLVLLGGEDGRRKFLEALESMPQGTRKLWKEALKKLKSRCLFVSLPDVDELFAEADLAKLVGHVDLIAADDARCSLLGLSDEDVAAVPGEHCIEVVRFHAIDQATCVAESRQAAKAEIKRGQSPDIIWESRVADLARYSKDVVVVDRYCGADVERSSGSATSGLEFVLRRLWNSDLSVAVLMADPRPKPGADYASTTSAFRAAVQGMIARILEDIGPRERDLVLFRLPDRAFANLSHDRYMRFDSWLLKLDTGVEPFSSGSTPRARTLADLSVCSRDDLIEKQKIEKRLKVQATGVMRLKAGVTCLESVVGE